MTGSPDTIDSLRAELGDDLLLLGHHYQRPAVLTHADAIGDSLELSKRAAVETHAKKIAFCGVHFMAESADILTSDEQAVYMPEPKAGCPMANMASEEQMKAAWECLQGWSPDEWIPVVYVNSTAGIKALCGDWGGATCTSSNAERVFKWVLDQGKRIFFLPDEHLGANSAARLGIPDDEVLVYDPKKDCGGLTPEAAAEAKVVAWKGFCNVHTAFRTEHIEAVRTNWPDATIIVHPETPREVLKLADEDGSTSQIIKYVEGLKDGSMVFIGTEFQLVNRLAETHADRLQIRALSQSLCANMYMTTEDSLLHLLKAWPETHRITVEPDVKAGAKAALSRMLSL